MMYDPENYGEIYNPFTNEIMAPAFAFDSGIYDFNVSKSPDYFIDLNMFYEDLYLVRL